MKLQSHQVIPQTEQDVEFLNSYLNRNDIVIGESYTIDFDCLQSMIKLKIPIDGFPVGIYMS